MSHAIVIGAGMVGLATAWHLQERGLEVTVIDKEGVAAGSSWGNAGWLSPGKTIPLSHPSLWGYGPKALLDPDAALHVPARVDPTLWSFFARFMAHATTKSWDRTMAALTPIDKLALEGFDELTDGGIESWTRKSPFVVGFENEKQSQGFLGEVAGAVRHGQDVPFEPLENPRELAPMLSENVKVAYRLEGQRFFEPGPFMEALGQAFVQRGGTLRTGVEVTDVNSTRTPSVTLSTGEHLTADTVVIATGAWLPRLAAPLGVKVKVRRARVLVLRGHRPTRRAPRVPAARAHGLHPYQGRFRIAGTMEFKHADEPFDPGRITATVNEARKLMTGVDLDARQDEWVGSRPVTPDGLPLIGATQVPNVYVAGGHGMWGMVLGPITGRLLADQITTGAIHPAITPFDPLR